MKKFFISSLLSLTFIFSSAQLLADYASRMKERYYTYWKLKTLVLLGEGTDGLSTFVRRLKKNKKNSHSENEDRKILFNTMATKTAVVSMKSLIDFQRL